MMLNCSSPATGRNQDNAFVQLGDIVLSMCTATSHTKDPEKRDYIRMMLLAAAGLSNIQNNVSANPTAPECHVSAVVKQACSSRCGDKILVYSPKTSKRFAYCSLDCVMKMFENITGNKWMVIFLGKSKGKAAPNSQPSLLEDRETSDD